MFRISCASSHCRLNEFCMLADGVVVCSGIGCMVSFTNVHFVKCTLVVLAGAEANLQACEFTHALNSPHGLSVLAHGEQTSLYMNGSSITGGAVGVTVHSGANLKMSDVALSKLSVSGVESQGDKSSVHISTTSFKEFSSCCTYTTHSHAIHAHAGSSINVKEVTITGQCMDYGVLVHSLATASMLDCTISDIKKAGVEIGPGSTGHLQACTISRSKDCGLHVSGRDSTCDAVSCTFAENYSSGACASRHSKLQMQSCASMHNEGVAGYNVKAGATLKLIECSSFADTVGCRAVGTYAALTAHMCKVSSAVNVLAHIVEGARAELSGCTFEKSAGEGVLVESIGTWAFLEGCTVSESRGSCVLVKTAAKAALKWCTLQSSVDWNGLDSHDVGTEVHLEQCVVKNNKQNGICAGHGSVGKAISCRSTGNVGFGFSAWSQGHMTAIECSSDGNAAGASGSGGDGVLVKERLWCNGMLHT